MSEAPKMPLSEAIIEEMEELQQVHVASFGDSICVISAYDIIRKHFAALSVEEVARALCGWRNGARSDTPFDEMSEAEQAAYRDQAQAVMKLLRKE